MLDARKQCASDSEMKESIGPVFVDHTEDNGITIYVKPE
jgi:hypothetical protein